MRRNILIVILILSLSIFLSGCIAQKKSVNEMTDKLWLIGNLHPVISQHFSYSIENYTITDYQVGDVPVKLNLGESLISNDTQKINTLQVISFGEIKNITVQVPLDKSQDAPTTSEIITYFDPENLSGYEFYNINFPENVTLQQQFELNLKLINQLPFSLDDIRIHIKNEGLEPKEYEKSVSRININDTNDLSFNFKAIKPGYHRFDLKIYSENTFAKTRISVKDDFSYRIHVIS